VSYYVPGLGEKDTDKTIRSLMQAHENTATNAADIAALQAAAAGYVVGPASSTNNGFVKFDGTTGKLVKDHAATIALASEVSGNLPVANLNSGTGAGATTFWRGDATWTVPVLSSITASLGADVALNNVANYFDGPSVAQGSTGTWYVSGGVTVQDTTTTAAIYAKLWDGTTVIDSRAFDTSASTFYGNLFLSGIITSPAGNLRISVRDVSTTSGKIIFNRTGNSKDSSITAVRIA
jgi:hypothetical protein